MSNEDFQKAVLSQLQGIKVDIGEIKSRVTKIEIRQDEIYQVVSAIEHSNQVGRSELDSQNIRIAKLEGKFKKASKVFIEDIEVDKASNL